MVSNFSIRVVLKKKLKNEKNKKAKYSLVIGFFVGLFAALLYYFGTNLWLYLQKSFLGGADVVVLPFLLCFVGIPTIGLMKKDLRNARYLLGVILVFVIFYLVSFFIALGGLGRTP